MTSLVPIVLFGWLPFGLAMFLFMRPRRAVLVIFIGGWLLLPVGTATGKIVGLPEYDKVMAVVMPAILGVLLFDSGRLIRLVPRWVDLPILIWCLVPIPTSLVNGLGLYDGLSGAFGHTLLWGVPYVMGRLYFTDLNGLYDLALGLIVGGLIYIPLCLYEVRMSPQLHAMLYGYAPTGWGTVRRFGGWRPVVFMNTGLAVAIWMAMTSLAMLAVWRIKRDPRLFQIHIAWFAIPLWITTVLCKSAGAVGLLVVGGAILLLAQGMRSRWPMVAVMLIVPLYLGLRVGLQWEGQGLVQAAERLINEQRADSLQFRIDNEQLILDRKFEQRPWLGWGAWGRNRVFNERGQDITVTDSAWILAASKFGLVGLVGMFGVLVLPVYFVCRYVPPSSYVHWRGGLLLALALVIWIFTIDRLLNAQVNPVSFVLAGGMIGAPWQQWAAQTRRSGAAPDAATARTETRSAGPGSLAAPRSRYAR